MKAFRCILFTLLLAACSPRVACAQNQGPEVQVAYVAPFLSQSGGSLGAAFQVHSNDRIGRKGRTQIQSIKILPQFTYFRQREASTNFFFHPELVYKLQKQNGRSYLLASLGVGYLATFQRQEGRLDLGSGEIEYDRELLHGFFSGLNAGIGVDLRANFGLFVKATYGRAWRFGTPNTAFFGATVGAQFTLKAKE